MAILREEITVANNMIVGINGLVATGLVIAEDVVVAVAKTLAAAELYIDVTNDMLVAVS